MVTPRRRARPEEKRKKKKWNLEGTLHGGKPVKIPLPQQVGGVSLAPVLARFFTPPALCLSAFGESPRGDGSFTVVHQVRIDYIYK